MSDKYNFKQFKIKPHPEAKQLEDGRQIRIWHLEMASLFPLGILVDLSQKLLSNGVKIDLQCAYPKILNMSVISDKNIRYSDESDATFRAMLLLESIIGPISTIEGIPRSEWKMEFVVLESTGGLEKDKTPLMLAAQKGDLATVKSLLENDNLTSVNINALSPNGNTALMYAAAKGHENIVNLLLKSGANVNIYGSEYTSLEMAVASSNINIVKQFINYGANVNAKNQYGETALMYAVAWGLKEIVELLISNER